MRSIAVELMEGCSKEGESHSPDGTIIEKNNLERTAFNGTSEKMVFVVGAKTLARKPVILKSTHELWSLKTIPERKTLARKPVILKSTHELWSLKTILERKALKSTRNRRSFKCTRKEGH